MGFGGGGCAAGRPCNIQTRSCAGDQSEAAVAGLWAGDEGDPKQVTMPEDKTGGTWFLDEVREKFLEQLPFLPTMAVSQLFSFIERKFQSLEMLQN